MSKQRPSFTEVWYTKAFWFKVLLAESLVLYLALKSCEVI